MALNRGRANLAHLLLIFLKIEFLQLKIALAKFVILS